MTINAPVDALNAKPLSITSIIKT